MIKVSVIIPVFNVERYLKKCLDSVINQTFDNYEIIIINDGSTDNSAMIIEEYKEKYPKKIRFYNKKNGGLSDARNMGILKSKGKYLMFIDSDDYISNNMIEKMYNSIVREDSDMSICNLIKINKNGKEIKNYNYNPGTTTLENNKKILFNLPCACNKIYNKKLFNYGMFDKGKYYEDFRLINKLYLKCNKIAFIDDFCYYYVDRDNSIMHDKNIKRNYEIIEAIESIKDFYQKEKKYDLYKEELEFMMIDNLLISTFVRIITSSKKAKKDLNKFWDYINSNFPNYKKNKYIKYLSRNRKIIYFLNSNKLYFITKIIFKMKG